LAEILRIAPYVQEIMYGACVRFGSQCLMAGDLTSAVRAAKRFITFGDALVGIAKKSDFAANASKQMHVKLQKIGELEALGDRISSIADRQNTKYWSATLA
jgi:hypothetical protein